MRLIAPSEREGSVKFDENCIVYFMLLSLSYDTMRAQRKGSVWISVQKYDTWVCFRSWREVGDGREECGGRGRKRKWRK